MWRRHHADVPVGVVDVGSNTVRLLVAREGEAIDQRRAVLGLGESIERDGARSRSRSSHETADCVAEFVRIARAARGEPARGARHEPGPAGRERRRAARAARRAPRVPVRLLSAPPRRAGSRSSARSRRRVAAGTTAVAVVRRRRRLGAGHRRHADATARLDALDRRRLAAAREPLLRRRPARRRARSGRARAEVERSPRRLRARRRRSSASRSAAARARSARSSAPTLGADELERALDAARATRRPTSSSRDYGLDPGRTSTLAAGAVILAALQAAPRAPRSASAAAASARARCSSSPARRAAA